MVETSTKVVNVVKFILSKVTVKFLFEVQTSRV